jgi:LacI family transcriptional regulator
MSTQKDVAKLANVSFITVSRVINEMGNVKESTRNRVLQAIEELNYYPNSMAQRLNKNKINTLAIQAPLPQDVGVEETSYYRRLLIGIERCCIKHNYDILLSTQRGTVEDFDCLRPYYERKADGIALLGARPTDEQYAKILEDRIPYIVIGDRHPRIKGYYIDTDNFQGMYDATKYLIERNHKLIAYIEGNRRTSNATDRFKGFCTAMEDNDLTVQKDLIYTGDFSKQSGVDALRYYINKKVKPTAILASTDLMAIGVYEEAKEMGLKIPEDISIFGFDGHEICRYTSPPLATMHQPLQ